ncbi:MAG: DUF4489 domain-containing protein [Clostridium sp.]|uniref:DUF4489 domain-containing protein n=1 Tax=Clostridium sp. TaxID=1506 RepID=UPI0025BF40CE|nr:DUF4489 domain-containing protein [Clostridium sp.]MCF0149130.1 DUF4489 domain-containing protein [Clostridium sp.]
MNSMSRGYYESCGKEKRREEEKCPTIIKCGCPSSTTIPAATAAGTMFTLASLTLDTSCICDPSIKIDFASNPVLTGFVGTLNLRVFKQCRNQFAPVPVGPTWTISSGAAVTDARTFSFFICDSDSCDRDCCTYTVVATVVGAATAGTIAINNSTLGAIATCRESCKECRRG